MKKIKISLLFIFGCIGLLLYGGCSTNRYSTRPLSSPDQTAEGENVSLTLHFLGEEQLTERFGKEHNPFLPPPSALGLNRMIVFQLEVKPLHESSEKRPFVIPLKETELQFGGRNKSPVNRFHLTQFWESKKDKVGMKGRDLVELKKIIQENVLPNELSIEENTLSTGLLVFTGRFPKYGKAVVYVPLFLEKNRPVNTFSFEFEF